MIRRLTRMIRRFCLRERRFMRDAAPKTEDELWHWAIK